MTKRSLDLPSVDHLFDEHGHDRALVAAILVHAEQLALLRQELVELGESVADSLVERVVALRAIRKVLEQPE